MGEILGIILSDDEGQEIVAQLNQASQKNALLKNAIRRRLPTHPSGFDYLLLERGVLAFYHRSNPLVLCLLTSMHRLRDVRIWQRQAKSFLWQLMLLIQFFCSPLPEVTSSSAMPEIDRKMVREKLPLMQMILTLSIVAWVASLHNALYNEARLRV